MPAIAALCIASHGNKTVIRTKDRLESKVNTCAQYWIKLYQITHAYEKKIFNRHNNRRRLSNNVILVFDDRTAITILHLGVRCIILSRVHIRTHKLHCKTAFYAPVIRHDPVLYRNGHCYSFFTTSAACFTAVIWQSLSIQRTGENVFVRQGLGCGA